MKRLRIPAILMCLLLLTVPVTALEGVFPQVCPLNTAVQFEYLGEEMFLRLDVFNATEHPISYLEFSTYLFDKDGNPAKDAINNFFYAHVPQMDIEPFTDATFYWSVKTFSGAVESRDFRIEKVIFKSGEIWTHPQTPLFAQPFLYASNARTADGRYILDANHALNLVDYSYSSESRIWYIWNDGPGWVPFSRDLLADCQVWTPGVAIKLEINGKPNLEPESIFHVVTSPGAVAMHPYVTGVTTNVMPVESFYGEILPATEKTEKEEPAPEETPAEKPVEVQEENLPAPETAPAETVTAEETVEKAVKEEEPSALANFTVDSGLPIGDVPLYLGLWDYTESESRAWSIWDGTKWMTFSYDRAPLCEIWRTGTIYLKLTYPYGEAVYALEVNGV